MEVSREDFNQLQRDVSDMRSELEQLQMKWRLFFGTDKFRKDRARKGAAARWAGHKAKRPSPRPLTGFDPFAE